MSLFRWRGRPEGGETGAGDEHPLLVLGQGLGCRRRTDEDGGRREV